MRTRVLLRVLLAVTAVAACGAAAPPGIDALRWKRRVVLLSAPADDDPRLQEQRRILAEWRQGAEERDVTVVQIVGAAVDGVNGTANDLRRRFALPPGQFTAVLLGKDGHVAVRSREPVDGALLTRTIDAMPMRRAGER